jgi:hypothetical protein
MKQLMILADDADGFQATKARSKQI